MSPRLRVVPGVFSPFEQVGSVSEEKILQKKLENPTFSLDQLQKVYGRIDSSAYIGNVWFLDIVRQSFIRDQSRVVQFGNGDDERISTKPRFSCIHQSFEC
jgi:hypothetical protein